MARRCCRNLAGDPVANKTGLHVYRRLCFNVAKSFKSEVTVKKGTAANARSVTSLMASVLGGDKIVLLPGPDAKEGSTS
jgi:phosphotransferase system HPr-like phosphotransfer protein